MSDSSGSGPGDRQETSSPPPVPASPTWLRREPGSTNPVEPVRVTPPSGPPASAYSSPPVSPPPVPPAPVAPLSTPPAAAAPPPVFSRPVGSPSAGVAPLSQSQWIGRTVAVSVLIAALVVTLVVFVVMRVKGQGDTTAASVSSVAEPSPARTSAAPIAQAPPSSEPTAPTSAAPSPSTVNPEPAALAQLESVRAQDVQNVTLRRQWVAQIASKVPGIVDPKQTNAAGSHTFMATDILAEHLRLRSEENLGARVFLLLSTDYGLRRTYGGKALWVTFAEGSFSDADDVRAWCAARFTGLSGDALVNACTPRQLNPIGG